MSDSDFDPKDFAHEVLMDTSSDEVMKSIAKKILRIEELNEVEQHEDNVVEYHLSQIDDVINECETIFQRVDSHPNSQQLKEENPQFFEGLDQIYREAKSIRRDWESTNVD